MSTTDTSPITVVTEGHRQRAIAYLNSDHAADIRRSYGKIDEKIIGQMAEFMAKPPFKPSAEAKARFAKTMEISRRRREAKAARAQLP